MQAKGATIAEIETKVQQDINAPEIWCEANNMKMNTLKTKSMLFYHENLQESEKLTLKPSVNKIERVKQFK